MLTLKLRTIQLSIVALGLLAFASALAASPAAQATRLLRTPTVSATQIALWYRPHTNLKAWVLDVETGKAKVVGGGPWMVPQRALAPVWSPDSKWVACASRLESLYRAILVTNVDTGETKQVTDGLADAMYPVFDASGKGSAARARRRGSAASARGETRGPGREGTAAACLGRQEGQSRDSEMSRHLHPRRCGGVCRGTGPRTRPITGSSQNAA
jgi:hypothetical protein